MRGPPPRGHPSWIETERINHLIEGYDAVAAPNGQLGAREGFDAISEELLDNHLRRFAAVLDAVRELGSQGARTDFS